MGRRLRDNADRDVHPLRPGERGNECEGSVKRATPGFSYVCGWMEIRRLWDAVMRRKVRAIMPEEGDSAADQKNLHFFEIPLDSGDNL